MPPSSMGQTKAPKHQSFRTLMAEWPGSWAGVEADKPFGAGLVAELEPFMAHLETLGLKPKTVRRHLDNLWVIGGEIIRQLNYEPALRKTTPRKLLFETVENGEAPFVPDMGEAGQKSLDATARRLLRFLASSQ
jgi:hypothetical protein